MTMRTLARIVGVLILTTLAACESAAHISPERNALVHLALPPVPVSYLGVYEPEGPSSYRQVRNFGQAVGRKPNIVVYYSAVNEPFQSAFDRKARGHGATVLVQIEPWHTSMTAVASGAYDSWLRSYADAVVRFGHPVMISWAQEANGDWYPWGYRHVAPAMWVRAWRHIVNVFRARGAYNVTWVWDMNRDNHGNTGRLKNWWPGAKYVTWVGIDGYYFRWSDTYHSVLGRTIADARTFTSRPVLVEETAVGQVAGQAAKIPGLFAGIRRDHVLGLVWFDEAQHHGLYHQDWRLENHPAGLAAFRKALGELTTPKWAVHAHRGGPCPSPHGPAHEQLTGAGRVGRSAQSQPCGG